MTQRKEHPDSGAVSNCSTARAQLPGGQPPARRGSFQELEGELKKLEGNVQRLESKFYIMKAQVTWGENKIFEIIRTFNRVERFLGIVLSVGSAFCAAYALLLVLGFA